MSQAGKETWYEVMPEVLERDHGKVRFETLESANEYRAFLDASGIKSSLWVDERIHNLDLIYAVDEWPQGVDV